VLSCAPGSSQVKSVRLRTRTASFSTQMFLPPGRGRRNLSVKSSQVKSSQVVELRTRTASLPTQMFPPPGVAGYDGDPGG